MTSAGTWDTTSAGLQVGNNLPSYLRHDIISRYLRHISRSAGVQQSTVLPAVLHDVSCEPFKRQLKTCLFGINCRPLRTVTVCLEILSLSNLTTGANFSHWVHCGDYGQLLYNQNTGVCTAGSVTDAVCPVPTEVDIKSRGRLRSSSTALLYVTVPRSVHKTIGDRAVPVAAARVWNMLPPSITSLPSMQTFKRALKTELFRRSYDNAH